MKVDAIEGTVPVGDSSYPWAGLSRKRKRFIIEPMPLEEAIEQMEQLGHNFFLYFDADADEARLLYRRNDGDYGLIEPEFQ